MPLDRIMSSIIEKCTQLPVTYRLWPAIPPNPLATLASSAPRQKTCTFSASLQKARLAYLWEHTIHSRPLLPATAMFEAAAAAGRCLHGESFMLSVQFGNLTNV